VAETAIGEDNN